jgi:hypothetical protein
MAGNGWSNNIVSTLIFEEGTGFTGLFFYSPTVGKGNLVGSWTANAGVDPYGNSYPDGLSVVGGTIFTPNLVAASITAGTIGSSTITNSTFMGGTVSDSDITFDSSGGVLLMYATTTQSATFSTHGTGTWTAPAGVTSVKAECWGSGATMQSIANRIGGGGGEYAQEPAVAVTPGNSYAYAVSAGDAASPVNSTFTGDSVTVVAHGASTQAGATGSSNSIHFNGGDGGSVSGFPSGGGGGGSSAGTSTAGAAGNANSGNTGGAGGTAPSGGGSGGTGGTYPGHESGFNGSAPGGGGGGLAVDSGGATTGTAGIGADGQVKLTWVTSNTLIGSVAPVAGTDQFGNDYPAGFMGALTAIEPGSDPTVVETWHTASLATGFTTSAGDQAPRYRLEGIAGGVVRLDGVLFTSAATAADATAFTLPTGYWPLKRQRFVGSTNASGYTTVGSALVAVSTAGVVSVTPATNAAGQQIVLDGIVFPID